MYCDIPEFGRCCFCLPLRRGILVFGYLNVVFSAFMVGMYSYVVDKGIEAEMIYHGMMNVLIAEVIIALYCAEVVVNCLLVYGAHQKLPKFLRIWYYYTLTTFVLSLALQVIEVSAYARYSPYIEDLILALMSWSIQVYLILLVRSLLKKLEVGSQHAFDNQLHVVVSGDTGVYNNCTTVPVNE